MEYKCNICGQKNKTQEAIKNHCRKHLNQSINFNLSIQHANMGIFAGTGLENKVPSYTSIKIKIPITTHTNLQKGKILFKVNQPFQIMGTEGIIKLNIILPHKVLINASEYNSLDIGNIYVNLSGMPLFDKNGKLYYEFSFEPELSTINPKAQSNIKKSNTLLSLFKRI